MQQFIRIIKKPKIIAAIAMLFSLLMYLWGVEWLLLVVLLGVYAAFLPMPKVFTSWFSRVLLSLLFLYALLQVAALAQFYLHPTGRFPLIATLTVVLTIVTVWVFGDWRHSRYLRIVNFMDVAVILGSLVFLVPFAPALMPQHSLQTIAEYGGAQIVDSLAHQNTVHIYDIFQTLAQGYNKSGYYPAGFHIAAGFVEHTFIGDFQGLSWKGGALLYFAGYIGWAMLLCAILIYTSLLVLQNLRLAVIDRWSILTTALVVGTATSIMHLWSFIDLGFLNYFYICAAALGGASYLLDHPIAFAAQRSVSECLREYSWPITAFLLLSFGASMSWPLLVPVFLLSAAWLIFSSFQIKTIRSHWRLLAISWLPIGIAVGLHLTTVLIQQYYGGAGNGHMIVATGALTNFNTLFLTIGLVVTATVIYKKATTVQDSIMAVVIPYVVLVTCLVALHLALVGEVRYYAIKVAMPLEMLFLAIGVSYLVSLFKEAGLNGLKRLVLVGSLVVCVVILNAATLATPFKEIKGLFRAQLQPATEVTHVHDAQLIARLGVANKLQNFNMITLHYDAEGDRLYGNPQLFGWAGSVGPYIMGSTPDVLSETCLAQLGALLYAPSTPDTQNSIKQKIRQCIEYEARYHVPMYIVTDAASVPALQAAFGNSAKLTY